MGDVWGAEVGSAAMLDRGVDAVWSAGRAVGGGRGWFPFLCWFVENAFNPRSNPG